MQHFPIFLDLVDEQVVVAGAGAIALAKLRLLLKTPARISVYGTQPATEIADWAGQGRLRLTERQVEPDDLVGTRLLYAASGDSAADSRAARLGRNAGAWVNIVDDLGASDFITPAIVDRSPVTVAIGTEGAAPVLARRIKADIEARLAPETGTLAKIARSFRPKAEAISPGRARRRFWQRFFDDVGPRALRRGGTAGAQESLADLLAQETHGGVATGRVTVVGAGPGSADLLTLRARNALDAADIVIHDRLVPAGILELARREAAIVDVGKLPGGGGWLQSEINTLLARHALAGSHVVRLKSGDPAVFGRLDEELEALAPLGVDVEIIPGITAASAAAAAAGVSLTRRRRNSGIRLLTGHDVDGFAEQDWRGLARPGATAAIYMGVQAARFLQGRLMMHGARADTPVTVVENASRPDQKIVAATFATLAGAMATAGVTGPAIILLGLRHRAAVAVPIHTETRLEEAL